MVSGYCAALPLNMSGKVEDTIRYLSSLHHLHGFEEIYVNPKHTVMPWNALERVQEYDTSTLEEGLKHLDFVHSVPEAIKKYATQRVEKFEEQIRQYLTSDDNSRSEEDLADLRLDHMVRLYWNWVIGCELQAELICSTPGILSWPINLLNSSNGICWNTPKLKYILELWFYTHMSNFDLKLPYFTQDLDPSSELSGLNKDLGQTRFLLSKRALVEESHEIRDQLVAQLRRYGFRINRFVRHSSRNIFVVGVSSAVTMLSGNLFSLASALVEVPFIAKHVRHDILHKEFDAHFVFEPPPFVYVPAFDETNKMIEGSEVLPYGQILFKSQPDNGGIYVPTGGDYFSLRARQEDFWKNRYRFPA